MKSYLLKISILICICTLGWQVYTGASNLLPEEEVLYNGIRLPVTWPPRQELLTREPMTVPYLTNPPELISINVGRQLFVDDFLIEHSTLTRTYHYPEYHPANPVLTFDKEWERTGEAPMAAPFSDGAWYDPKDGLFKMWYAGGFIQNTCYAVSPDGISWEKPRLDVVPGTNIVHTHSSGRLSYEDRPRDSSTIWLDHNEQDMSKRFKMFTTQHTHNGYVLALHVSPDGIHWSDQIAVSSGIGDRTTVFHNPFRNLWVYGLRIGFKGVGRARAYRENRYAGAGLQDTSMVLWMGADRLDPHNPNPEYSSIEPQLYNHDAAAYESLMLGFFSIWQGPDNRSCGELGIQKRNEILLGYSRDGFHWHRPDRHRFIGVNEKPGAWNWGNVQSVGGGCLVVRDKLYFYFSGRALCKEFWDGNASTGLAVLRRDGFASLDAGDRPGTLITRPVRFDGKHLFVNVNSREGELLAEILDKNGKVIEPYSRKNCIPASIDKTLTEIRWKGVADLSALSGRPVKFRFILRNGSLYSFWVSSDADGASNGFVAAGGPGFTGPRDTVGRKGH